MVLLDSVMSLCFFQAFSSAWKVVCFSILLVWFDLFFFFFFYLKKVYLRFDVIFNRLVHKIRHTCPYNHTLYTPARHPKLQLIHSARHQTATPITSLPVTVQSLITYSTGGKSADHRTFYCVVVFSQTIRVSQPFESHCPGIWQLPLVLPPPRTRNLLLAV